MDRVYPIITMDELLNFNKMLKKYNMIQIISMGDGYVAVRIPNGQTWLCKNLPMNLQDYDDEKDYLVDPETGNL